MLTDIFAMLERLYYLILTPVFGSFKVLPFLLSDAFDTEQLISCLDDLKNWKSVDVQNYDFKTHRSVSPARKV